MPIPLLSGHIPQHWFPLWPATLQARLWPTCSSTDCVIGAPCPLVMTTVPELQKESAKGDATSCVITWSMLHTNSRCEWAGTHVVWQPHPRVDATISAMTSLPNAAANARRSASMSRSSRASSIDRIRIVTVPGVFCSAARSTPDRRTQASSRSCRFLSGSARRCSNLWACKSKSKC